MDVTRRDFVKASSALVTALGLNATGILREEAMAGEKNEDGVPVVWLQGQSCNGCSVSLLNCIYYTTIDDLLVNTLDVEFHPLGRRETRHARPVAGSPVGAALGGGRDHVTSPFRPARPK